MKRLIACVAIASTLSCSRLGDMLGQIEQFVAVASLVDNVSYLPLAAGRRTPDSAQITTIGPEVTSVEIIFLDALTPASIAAFSIANNLVFTGVSADPTRPPSFNTEPIGRIRAGQVLTIPLASPLPEGGPFSVTLVSDPQRNELRTIGGESRFVGAFDFSFRVVARDGVRPVVSRIVTSNAEVSSLSALQTLAGGSVFDLVEPHSPIYLEFSEPMTSGIPVLTSPSFPVETTVTVDGVPFRFFVPRTPGLSFEEVRSPIIPGTLALASTEDSALMLETNYVIDILSDTSLGLQTTAATDLSGEPLAAFVEGLPQAPLMDFRLTLRSSGVSISVPSPRALVNRANLDEGTVRVAGTAAMHVDGIVVELLSPEGQALTSVPATMTGTTRPIPLFEVRTWEASLPASAFAEIEDTLRIRARSVAAGGDSIPVRVDTRGPKFLDSFGTLDLFANADGNVSRVCVAIESPSILSFSDADRADLYFRDPATGALTMLQSVEQAAGFDVEGGRRFGFCFTDVSVTGLVKIGANALVVQAYDFAGNVSSTDVELRIHPWLSATTPDRVRPLSLFETREVLLTGVGLASFDTANGDAVRIDDRDLVVPVAVVKIFDDGAFGNPIPPGRGLRFVVPESAATGGVTVRIAGQESNRLRFDVCRAEPPKFVTRRPLGDVDFTLERDAQGMPVFAWTVASGVIVTPSTSVSTAPSIQNSDVVESDLVRLLRRPDGSIAPVYTAANRFLRTPGFETALAFGEQPRMLDVAIDPVTGRGNALVISAKTVSSQSGSLVVARLFDLTSPGDPGVVIGSFASSTRGSFSGAMVFGREGTAWVLASGDDTRTWRRTGGIWTQADELFGFVSDAAASPDGSRFHAVLWRPGSRNPLDPSPNDPVFQLGVAAIDGAIAHYTVPWHADNWTLGWYEATTIEPAAFRKPVTHTALPRPAAALAASAAIRVGHDGQPRIAFMDTKRRSLRLLRAAPLGITPAVIDVMDVDVTLGLQVALALDGNGEAMIGSVDLSDPDEFKDEDEDGEDDDAVEYATIQLVDTRNANPVVAGSPQEPSRCSPGKFKEAFIDTANFAEVQREQADRWHFDFAGIAFALCIPQAAANLLSEEEIELCAKHGGSSLAARLLTRGSITFRGQVGIPGDVVDDTLSDNALVLPEENAGLRIPVGMRAALATTLVTPDAGIKQIHLAKFQPRSSAANCAATPSPRTGAAMAYDPFNDTTVLFGGDGGEDEDGNPILLNDTWVLRKSGSPGDECWVSISTPVAPPVRRNHTMGTAPRNAGVVLFGGVDALGSPVPGTWLFDPKANQGTWRLLSTADAPTARSSASITFDRTGQRMWLFGGRDGSGHTDDLWSLAGVGVVNPPVDFVWERETAALGPEAREGAGLVAAFPKIGEPNDRLVLFGGLDGGVRNDVWAFDLDLRVWDQLEPNLTTPAVPPDPNSLDYRAPARRGPAMAFPDRWEGMAVFGGQTEGFGFFGLAGQRLISGSTLDGYDPLTGRWDLLMREDVPLPRVDQASTFDTTEQRLVVFGGTYGTQLLNDTVAFQFLGSSSNKSGVWRSIVPGSVEPGDLILGGTRLNGDRVQWTRADSAPLLESENASDFLRQLSGKGEFPPVGNLGGAIAVRLDETSLGPVKFPTLFRPEPRVPGEQGVFESKARLGFFRARGKLLVAGAEVADLEITTNLPVPGPFEPPLPELGCTLLLNAPTVPVTSREPLADVRTAPVIAHDDFSRSEFSLQSHETVTGTAIQQSLDLSVPICVNVVKGGVRLNQAGLSGFLGGTAEVVNLVNQLSLSSITRFVGLDALGQEPGADAAGAFGFLGTLLGDSLVDAFSFKGSVSGGLGFEDHRTDDFRAITRFQQVGSGYFRDEPEWLVLDESGVRLSVRRAPNPLVQTLVVQEGAP